MIGLGPIKMKIFGWFWLILQDLLTLNHNFGVECKFLEFHPKWILNIGESVDLRRFMRMKISVKVKVITKMNVLMNVLRCGWWWWWSWGGWWCKWEAMNGARTKAEWVRAGTHTLFSAFNPDCDDRSWSSEPPDQSWWSFSPWIIIRVTMLLRMAMNCVHVIV